MCEHPYGGRASFPVRDDVHDTVAEVVLFAKTLCNGGTPIDFNNSYPISVDTSLANNKLNQELPMSWGNLVCRYGYKFGWKVFGHRGMQYLDTALTGNPVGADAIASEKINEVTREIEARIRLLQNTL